MPEDKFFNFLPPVTTSLVCNNIATSLLLCSVFIATYLLPFCSIIPYVSFSWLKQGLVFPIKKIYSKNFTYILNCKNMWLTWSNLEFQLSLLSCTYIFFIYYWCLNSSTWQSPRYTSISVNGVILTPHSSFPSCFYTWSPGFLSLSLGQ